MASPVRDPDPPSVKKRILFVDDEPMILQGLRNLLHRDSKRWNMVFAPSGEVALDEIHKEPFHVVVSDMRMPGVDGADLLNHVKAECPATVRIMLSGQADRDTISRALPALHQLLAKPCDVRTLRGVLERSVGGADTERDAKIQRVVCGIAKLPTPPNVFFELTRRMQSKTSVSDIADVVMRDAGLSAKVLQLVNSAYFGAAQTIASIPQAVTRLGTDQLRYIALTTAVFGSPELHDACWFHLDELQRGTVQAAQLARQLADPALRDEAFAATLLHDIGHIVLALGRGHEFAELHAHARSHRSELELEHDLFGITHADIGARLLAIWGLPPILVDAIQYHHDPGNAPESSRQLASIVHFADAAVPHLPVHCELNLASLERAGCAQLIQRWRAVADRAAHT